MNTTEGIILSEAEMEMGSAPKPARSKVQSGQKVADQIGRVIFPDNKWIKRWDMLILALLFYISFVTPYQVGVSLGRRLWQSKWWMIFNVIINTIFFVDTFLYFWRAYRTADGHVILHLRHIRARYLRSYFIPNLISNTPSVIISYFVYRNQGFRYGGYVFDFEDTGLLVFIWLATLLKLVRLARVKTIVRSSNVLTDFQDRYRTQILELVKYAFMLVVASHWFACTWCLVAFIEARGNFGAGLLESRNWISSWYNSTYKEGGLQPVGINNDTHRYVLSLFWAIQTITSIGYGNITPFTPVEWWISSLMMLCAGVMWAYTIGGLVGVTAAMFASDEMYRSRLDEARTMVKHFNKQEDGFTHHHVEECKAVARRIRRYIHTQKKLSDNVLCVNSLDHSFPVLNTLSPQLRMKSSLLILNDCIEMVNYLSSRFLTFEQQSDVAMKCLFLDFPANERIDIDNGIGDFGRGIFIIRRGVAFASRPKGYFLGKNKFRLLVVGTLFGDDTVLLEDGRNENQGFLHFLTFAKVVFIPRQSIIAAIDRTPKAWKDCARWKYFQALLRNLNDVKMFPTFERNGRKMLNC